MTDSNQTDYFLHTLLRARDWQDRPEFDDLCDWWKNIGGGVCALVGIGGAGKTAIVDRFLHVLPGGYPELATGTGLPPAGDDPAVQPPPNKRTNLPETVQPFIFSFYDVPNEDSFFVRLGEWLAEVAADCRPAAVKADADVQRLSIGHIALWLQNLARQRERTLLVLDGLEKVQDDGRRSGRYGHIPDGRLRNLLLNTAEGRLGRLAILITTRFDLYDPLAERVQYCLWLEIEQLDADSCVRLLRARGVLEPDDTVLRRLAEEHGRHALTVDLIGGYIGEFCGGDVSRLTPLGEIDLSDLDPLLNPRVAALIAQERRFARVAERYRESLKKHEPATLSLLERLCLFRLGVNAGTLVSIFTGEGKKSVAGPALAGLTPEQLEKTLDRLVAMKLIEKTEPLVETVQNESETDQNPSSLSSGHSALFSIHPAVRDGFLSGLDADTAQRGHEAARTGLTAVLGDAPGKNPSDPATLDLLEEIVHHTIQSGHVLEAWDIYWNRIGEFKNLGHRLGAYERGERICRAFTRGESPEIVARLFESRDHDSGGRGSRRAASDGTIIGSAGASLSHYLLLPEDRQGSFINEWALYLKELGRLAAAARCYELCIEMRMSQDWKNASIGNQNLCDVLLLSGHLTRSGEKGGLSVAAEALRLAERAGDAQAQTISHSYCAQAHALRGEVGAALADFSAALDWQYKVDGCDNPLYGIRGVYHTHLLARVGRRQEVIRLTEANKQICDKLAGTGNIFEPLCNLVLSDLPGESLDPSSRESLCRLAHDWAVARDAKEVLCRAALVAARIDLSTIVKDRTEANEDNEEDHHFVSSCSKQLEDGLKIARDCGYGIFHVDLLLERARLHLLAGDPQSALDDLGLALDDGIEANELKDMIDEARKSLKSAMDHWQPLHDPEPERPDQNFQHDGKEYNFRAAETWQVLQNVAGGVLTKYPLEMTARSEPKAISDEPQGSTRLRVKPAMTLPSTARSVFISYAHADNENEDPKKRWLDRFVTFLKPFVRQEDFTVCSDQEILIGDNWHQHIQTHLAGAKAAVLLISPDFLASDYIANSELPVLLKQAADTGLKIFPIIISPCSFSRAEFKYPDPKTGPDQLMLSSIQSANPPSTTLVEMNEGKQNRVLTKVAEQLADLLNP